MQKQDGQAQRRACLRREGGVAAVVHVPGIRTEEPVALQGRHISAAIRFRQHRRIHREIGRPAGGAEPAAVAAHVGCGRRLADRLRPATAEQGAHRAADVGLERGSGGSEILFVEQLVVPLTDRELVGRIDRTVDQGHDGCGCKAAGQMRNAQVGDGGAAFGVVGREAPHHRTAPIVPDPDRAAAAQRIEQGQHVGHAVLHRVVLMARMDC